MTNAFQNPNAQNGGGGIRMDLSTFEIRHSFVIRHSTFVIFPVHWH